jgi:hypothetical protein
MGFLMDYLEVFLDVRTKADNESITFNSTFDNVVIVYYYSLASSYFKESCKKVFTGIVTYFLM